MQGFNRYVPPELEGTTSGNAVHKRRAPGTLRNGLQTVRFEMPYAVWCHTCKPHAIIGQGVRFNAEKKKVGYYHSTPVWSFRMKHTACSGTIEIRTDPKNTAYVVTEGGKARDYGEPKDRVREGENGVPILTAEEREQRREDAFANLEGKAAEKALVKDITKRIEELYEARDRDWDDPWRANRRVRESFRHDRKALKREAEADEAIKNRIGTEIELLPENDSDRIRAKLIGFGKGGSGSEGTDASSKAVFSSPKLKSATSKSAKSTRESRKEALRRQLVSNTRAALNPFGG
ncbi:hypothetical protein TI39_contig315g00033 [Zymoseptoria brevis]|uniref:DUF455 domain protein n=1 Tax=Zymoseptoria brevis TaxID=1047168 RepID=A0A0F4GWZ3_9PEZI|nr:hypothetical protein TI39_contig315g00033 [Zymoseptoria brevis]